MTAEDDDSKTPTLLFYLTIGLTIIHVLYPAIHAILSHVAGP